MPAPGPNEQPITVVELDGRRTVHTAEEWHTLCSKLRGMRVCMTYSVLDHCLFKRELVDLASEDAGVSDL
jgi:hypothetical protein